ncbi:d176b2f1-a39c-4f38-b8d5-c40895e0b8a6 [Thermothielavioides terrestris]|uniref:D176b2f1-a39c-4f38-b8d5-c40895e0b8a6 n=1 Tax=Thermothielavioides terrestris TaxID=2587410 RepID=A0A446BWI1_9PEZI|nr:d176b2f1-a39c-4f38-b8d5-c40895e0b8a6 [Thermothielavioides terrestris]
MDLFLQTLGVQTFNYAVRSGIALTSRYAVQQCSRLLKSVNDQRVRAELKELQQLLDHKVKIISPALDLIQFKSGRGNVFLESAAPLAKSLHREIVRLGKRLDNAASVGEGARDAGRRGRVSEAHHAELLLIISDIKNLLRRIDRDIPLLQLAITASGEKMSTTLTTGISPSRMMQASALLSFADAHFVMNPGAPMQVGPSFTLSLYMLFLGHSPPAASGPAARDASTLAPAGSEDGSHSEGPYGLGEGERKPIWQESDGYSYHLEIIEDLDDGRLHDGDGCTPKPYDDMPMAGIRESIPIYQISKIFYTDTGRILNIGSNDERDSNPVLLLKRDSNAKSPVEMRQEWFDEPGAEEASEPKTDTDDDSESSRAGDQDSVDRQLWEETERSAESPGSMGGLQGTRLPPPLDPEWLALEVYAEDDDADDDEEDGSEENEAGSGGGPDALTHDPQVSHDSLDSKLISQIRRVSIGAGSPARRLASQPAEHRPQQPNEQAAGSYVTRSPFGSITSSLSLLEMLIRLTSLQEFQQTSHLAVPDHILTFFLDETSTTGLQGEAQWRVRTEAKRRMGFDPYTDNTPPRQSGE